MVQLLEGALEESCNDLDSAIKSHCLESAEQNSDSVEEASINVVQGMLIHNM